MGGKIRFRHSPIARCGQAQGVGFAGAAQGPGHERRPPARQLRGRSGLEQLRSEGETKRRSDPRDRPGLCGPVWPDIFGQCLKDVGGPRARILRVDDHDDLLKKARL